MGHDALASLGNKIGNSCGSKEFETLFCPKLSSPAFGKEAIYPAAEMWAVVPIFYGI